MIRAISFSLTVVLFLGAFASLRESSAKVDQQAQPPLRRAKISAAEGRNHLSVSAVIEPLFLGG